MAGALCRGANVATIIAIGNGGRVTIENVMRASDVWPDKSKVLLTSFWGWDPHLWGLLSFTDKGLREKVRKATDDPFIGLVYTTKGSPFGDPMDRGFICGFYVLSHTNADRFQFTDSSSHQTNPNQWHYGLAPYAAYRFLPEKRVHIDEFAQSNNRVKNWSSLSRFGMFLDDNTMIAKLRGLYVEQEDLYRPFSDLGVASISTSSTGYVLPGPNRSNSYTVAGREVDLLRRLDILELTGNADHYLRRPANNRKILKVGLSYSPEARKRDLQKSYPNGKFEWKVLHPQSDPNAFVGTFAAAEKGETAMKKWLGSKTDSHLGGEFYVASPNEIAEAWRLGNEVAKSHFIGIDEGARKPVPQDYG